MEIGSIFELEIENLFRNQNNEFFLPFMKNKNYEHNYFFNTGRSAIEHLLRELSSLDSKKKILLPDFNCSSVIDAVKRANLNYDFYSINLNFQIDVNSIREKLDDDVQYIYIIQYFGGYQNEKSYNFLRDLQSQNFVVIEDLSHALYTSHEKFIGFGDYVLGSIRKWLPIPDGAFISSSHKLSMQSVNDSYNEYVFNYLVAQLMKNAYLANNSLNKEQYLNLNSKAMESLFSDFTIRKITDLSYNYLRNYNINSVIEKRLFNYNFLLENTKNFNFMSPLIINAEGQVPFGFVVLSEKRDELLDYLIKNKIYCNVHWRLEKEYSIPNSNSEYLSKRILTVPCDQRYDQNAMEYIIETLRNFEK